MRLKRVRVENYRSIRDTGWFDMEQDKTILVGPNEAGKTVLLQAIQHLNPPEGVRPFDPLRDYPRAEYNDITTKKIDPANVTIVQGKFAIEEADGIDLSNGFENATYVLGRKLDNTLWHRLDGSPPPIVYGKIQKDLSRLAAHLDTQTEQEPGQKTFQDRLSDVTGAWTDTTLMSGDSAKALDGWLVSILPYIDENNKEEEERFDRLKAALGMNARRDAILNQCHKHIPVFVYFNNYSRVKPLIHLAHLATRIETNSLDDAYYDYGNVCLLKLLGFDARQLSNLGQASAANQAQLQTYRDQLDTRSYQLNAASVRLTTEINKVWLPDRNRQDADRLRITADGQYLKVVVEDDLGVEIELDQRSEGFQWLVSFFVVFFAEAKEKHENAILLLDEPGLNLHALKQSDFRKTISLLGQSNQTIYTTHSPFMVGPDELDLVRVVEMTDRSIGTKVHTTVTASDSTAMLPLQEALGYDLAQSIFTQKRNMVVEGLTDYWYIEAVSQMLRNDGIANMDDSIALIPAGTASKVVYYATILHAQDLKVAALFDSDAEGENAANQDNLTGMLKQKSIMQVKTFYTGPAKKVETEDLLRDTLVAVAKSELGWDVSDMATKQPKRAIADIFAAEIPGFSKYKLAKAFLRWARSNDSSALTPIERQQWSALIDHTNRALK